MGLYDTTIVRNAYPFLPAEPEDLSQMKLQQQLTASDVMTPNPDCMPAIVRIRDLVHMLRITTFNTFPLVARPLHKLRRRPVPDGSAPAGVVPPLSPVASTLQPAPTTGTQLMSARRYNPAMSQSLGTVSRTAAAGTPTGVARLGLRKTTSSSLHNPLPQAPVSPNPVSGTSVAPAPLSGDDAVDAVDAVDAPHSALGPASAVGDIPLGLRSTDASVGLLVTPSPLTVSDVPPCELPTVLSNQQLSSPMSPPHNHYNQQVPPLLLSGEGYVLSKTRSAGPSKGLTLSRLSSPGPSSTQLPPIPRGRGRATTNSTRPPALPIASAEPAKHGSVQVNVIQPRPGQLSQPRMRKTSSLNRLSKASSSADTEQGAHAAAATGDDDDDDDDDDNGVLSPSRGSAVRRGPGALSVRMATAAREVLNKHFSSSMPMTTSTYPHVGINAVGCDSLRREGTSSSDHTINPPNAAQTHSSSSVLLHHHTQSGLSVQHAQSLTLRRASASSDLPMNDDSTKPLSTSSQPQTANTVATVAWQLPVTQRHLPPQTQQGTIWSAAADRFRPPTSTPGAPQAAAGSVSLSEPTEFLGPEYTTSQYHQVISIRAVDETTAARDDVEALRFEPQATAACDSNTDTMTQCTASGVGTAADHGSNDRPESLAAIQADASLNYLNVSSLKTLLSSLRDGGSVDHDHDTTSTTTTFSFGKATTTSSNPVGAPDTAAAKETSALRESTTTTRTEATAPATNVVASVPRQPPADHLHPGTAMVCTTSPPPAFSGSDWAGASPRSGKSTVMSPILESLPERTASSEANDAFAESHAVLLPSCTPPQALQLSTAPVTTAPAVRAVILSTRSSSHSSSDSARPPPPPTTTRLGLCTVSSPVTSAAAAAPPRRPEQSPRSLPMAGMGLSLAHVQSPFQDAADAAVASSDFGSPSAAGLSRPSVSTTVDLNAVGERGGGMSVVDRDMFTLGAAGGEVEASIVGIISRKTLLKLLQVRVGFMKSATEAQGTVDGGVLRYPAALVGEVVRKLDVHPFKVPTSAEGQDALFRDLTEEEMDSFINLRHYMQRVPFSLPCNASLGQAYRLFRSLGLHHMLVTTGDAPVVGVITRSDLVPDNAEVVMHDKLDRSLQQAEEEVVRAWMDVTQLWSEYKQTPEDGGAKARHDCTSGGGGGAFNNNSNTAPNKVAVGAATNNTPAAAASSNPRQRWRTSITNALLRADFMSPWFRKDGSAEQHPGTPGITSPGVSDKKTSSWTRDDVSVVIAGKDTTSPAGVVQLPAVTSLGNQQNTVSTYMLQAPSSREVASVTASAILPPPSVTRNSNTPESAPAVLLPTHCELNTASMQQPALAGIAAFENSSQVTMAKTSSQTGNVLVAAGPPNDVDRLSMPSLVLDRASRIAEMRSRLTLNHVFGNHMEDILTGTYHPLLQDEAEALGVEASEYGMPLNRDGARTSRRYNPDVFSPGAGQCSVGKLSSRRSVGVLPTSAGPARECVALSPRASAIPASTKMDSDSSGRWAPFNG